MNAPGASKNAALTLTIITYALIAESVVLVGVGYVLAQYSGKPEFHGLGDVPYAVKHLLNQMFPVLAIALTLGALFVRRKLGSPQLIKDTLKARLAEGAVDLEAPDAEKALKNLWAGIQLPPTLIALALAEAVGILGFVLFLLAGNFPMLLRYAGACILVGLVCRPPRFHAEDYIL